MFGYSPQGYEALSANRQRLLDALNAVAITEVTVRYVGGGDEGDVSEVIVQPESSLPQLNTQRLVYCYARGEYREGACYYFLEDKEVLLDDALRDFVFTWVDSHHSGWEINDGGSGVMTINVTLHTFTLAHTEYCMECNDYTYDLSGDGLSIITQSLDAN